MKQIAIEDVLRIEKERWAINQLKFKNIIWTKGGKEIDIEPKVKEVYAYCGLNNCDFITLGYYKQKSI